MQVSVLRQIRGRRQVGRGRCGLWLKMYDSNALRSKKRGKDDCSTESGVRQQISCEDVVDFRIYITNRTRYAISMATALLRNSRGYSPRQNAKVFRRMMVEISPDLTTASRGSATLHPNPERQDSSKVSL